MSGIAGLRVVMLSVLVAGLNGCSDSPAAPTDDAVFRLQACGTQGFNVRVTDRDTIAQAEALIGRADQPILSGRVRRGDGGFNSPHRWHLDPASIEFADLTIEVCDGCPADLDADLDYWVETVGQFCPWSSRVVLRLR